MNAELLSLQIEQKYAHWADLCCANSATSAQDLSKLAGLNPPCLIARSLPELPEPPPSEARSAIRVLVEGPVEPGRGLKSVIASVRRWDSCSDLTISGAGSVDYIASLYEWARRNGVAARVLFMPLIPRWSARTVAPDFDLDLVLDPRQRFGASEIGLKFAEAASRGRYLCVTPSREAAYLLARHPVGCTIDEITPAAISNIVDELDRSAFDRSRAAAIDLIAAVQRDESLGHLLAAVDEAARRKRRKVQV